MIKLKDLLTEKFADDFPKNKFIALSREEYNTYKEEIFNLIQMSYASKGGHLKYPSVDYLDQANLNYVLAADIDSDPDIDIFIGGRYTRNGVKITVAGTDGESMSKKKMLLNLIRLMKTNGFYAEVDLDMAAKMNLNYIKDASSLYKVVRHYIEVNPDGSYYRNIGGKKVKKVLVGIPSLTN
jgi:hypothetical protein